MELDEAEARIQAYYARCSAAELGKIRRMLEQQMREDDTILTGTEIDKV